MDCKFIFFQKISFKITQFLKIYFQNLVALAKRLFSFHKLDSSLAYNQTKLTVSLNQNIKRTVGELFFNKKQTV